MLRLSGVESFYGASQVLFGIDLKVGAGEVATLLGRNGMGKTTTVRAILALTPPRRGEIALDGQRLDGLPPYRIARAGIGLVPEGRHVFPTLSVRENLIATARGGGWTEERVFALFPRLSERAGQRAGTLSGGEQQMLAIGRALMTNPRLLILDEATEGLAPLIREEIWRCVEALKADGLAILLIDKNIDALLRLADRHHIIEKGRIVWTGGSAELAADEALRHRYLGV
ncbi:ABC transporter ATP-binding protein [Oceanibaculum indicum]|uniref:Branched-chain amino acid transport system ATP-binding protein n=1 Tax=Oceanibaculum indicum TaxID=526216 RepID=A0A420WQM3_9PROT|nr:ABC transporter ATP-binding protein [Oceanibaculum indicum]RKQ73324.1 branched-chain amino acid transport system ATP-binding protein [Oceanibaculum indicum]